MPGPKAVFQLVGQGVLAVVVAADRGADPAEGRGADVRGDPQQRSGAVRGGAELALPARRSGELHRGAVDGGDLQAPSTAGRCPRSASATAASSSNSRFMTCSPSSFLAWENALPDGIVRARLEAAGRAARTPSPARCHSRRRGTGRRPARRPRSSSRSAPGRTGARRALPAARGRSRPRRAVLPAGPAGPAPPASPSRNPARTRSGRPAPHPGPRPLLPAAGRNGRRRDDHGKLGRQQSSR